MAGYTRPVFHGAGLYVETSQGDPAAWPALAETCGIDPYRARILLDSGTPHLLVGIATTEEAESKAQALRKAGVHASAHEAAAIDALPEAVEASGFAFEAARLRFVSDAPRGGSASGACFHAGDPGLGEAVALCHVETPIVARLLDSEQERRYLRLELWGIDAASRPVRVAVRQDAFDYSGLGADKTLSAPRNFQTLRARLRSFAPAAAFDDAFPRTDLARNRFAPDTWIEVDLATGQAKSIPSRSNRLAYEYYARLRFLHALRRRAQGAHFLELS